MFAKKTTRRLFVLLGATAVALVAAPGSWAWAWPADGEVLRGFSVGSNPYAAGQHRGIDVGLGGARSVRAPAAGEITFAGSVPTNGSTVTIETGDGHRVSLTHLGPLLVRKGARVTEGQPLAAPGLTGVAEHEVPYVHLGVREADGETYVDPLSLLPARSAPAPAPAPAPAAAPAPPVPAPTSAPAPAPTGETAAATPSAQPAPAQGSATPPIPAPPSPPGEPLPETLGEQSPAGLTIAAGTAPGTRPRGNAARPHAASGVARTSTDMPARGAAGPARPAEP